MNMWMRLASSRTNGSNGFWGRATVLLVFLLFLSGCQTARNAMDRFSIDQRDVMVESLDHTYQRLYEVQDAFTEARAELIEFAELQEIPLRQRYEWLSERYIRCEDALEEAEAEIQDLNRVARRFFLSWEGELFDYTNPEVRNASRIQLNETREEFEKVKTEMQATQVLASDTLSDLRDYLYFMRHNLNDRAYASLNNPGVDLGTRKDELLQKLAATLTSVAELSDSLRVE